MQVRHTPFFAHFCIKLLDYEWSPKAFLNRWFLHFIRSYKNIFFTAQMWLISKKIISLFIILCQIRIYTVISIFKCDTRGLIFGLRHNRDAVDRPLSIDRPQSPLKIQPSTLIFKYPLRDILDFKSNMRLGMFFNNI